MKTHKTIPSLFQESLKHFSDNIMLREKKTEQYEGLTYKECGEIVKKITLSFHKYGLKKGDRVVLLSEGRNDWILTELALFHLGVISVPLSVKLIEPFDLKFRINHSEARMIITSPFQLDKILNIKEEIPRVEKIIVFDDVSKKDDKIISLKEFLSLYPAEDSAGLFDSLWQSVEENDCATISYTSGTTAEPKGIMLSHRNYTSNVEMAESLYEIPSWYTTLLILPWDHSFAHTVGIFPLIKNGASIASVKAGKTANETLRNIPINIKETKPVFLLSVPALAKNFRKNIEKNIKEKGAFVNFLFKLALNNAMKYHRMGYDRGKGLSLLRKPLVNIFDKILFSKIREAFGGRLKFFVGGGALLDIELQKFFCAVGMPMYQGYGLTEASPVISSNTPQQHKFGSSGIIARGIECKIIDENGKELPPGKKGEIVIRGENVMLGYWKNPEATRETIKDGWLYTGDMGYLDNDGFLYVLGRFKSLLISEDGEKYSPEGIEEALVNSSSIIEQCLLYNDHKPYTVGLIFPSGDGIKKSINPANINDKNKAVSEALNIIKNQIQRFYKGGDKAGMFPERWLPSVFLVITEGFTEQNGLMNSTMKVIRSKVYEKYSKEIEFLYTPEGKKLNNQVNFRNMSEILGFTEKPD